MSHDTDIKSICEQIRTNYSCCDVRLPTMQFLMSVLYNNFGLGLRCSLKAARSVSRMSQGHRCIHLIITFPISILTATHSPNPHTFGLNNPYRSPSQHCPLRRQRAPVRRRIPRHPGPEAFKSTPGQTLLRCSGTGECGHHAAALSPDRSSAW